MVRSLECAGDGVVGQYLTTFNPDTVCRSTLCAAHQTPRLGKHMQSAPEPIQRERAIESRNSYAKICNKGLRAEPEEPTGPTEQRERLSSDPNESVQSTEATAIAMRSLSIEQCICFHAKTLIMFFGNLFLPFSPFLPTSRPFANRFALKSCNSRLKW